MQKNKDMMRDPIEVLMKEHDEGLQQLKRLGDAAEYIRINGFSNDTFVTISTAICFIDTEIRRHNEKEEKFLFPLMERHVSAPPGVMRSEHRELWRAFTRLHESVEDVEEGRISATTVRELVQSSKALVDLLTSHILKENTVLFPMARQVLTGEEYELLRENISNATSLVIK